MLKSTNYILQVWTGTDVVALFQIHGFGPERHTDMNQHLNKVLAEWSDQVSALSSS